MANGESNIEKWAQKVGHEGLSAAAKKARQGDPEVVRKRLESKRMTELAKYMMEMAMTDDEVTLLEDIKSVSDIEGKNVVLKVKIMTALAKKATIGDLKAIELFTKLAGEYVEKQETKIESEGGLGQVMIYLPDNKRQQ